MSSWYGKSTTKQLDSLIDRKAKLSQLFSYPEFINELKAYNSKLLQYLSSSNNLIEELVTYIAVPPSPSDTDDRKYKYPLLAIQMIETQATCVHNAMFKELPSGGMYFQGLFKLLENKQQVLPLLAGYLFRANICLLNNRQKQAIDRIYLNPQLFNKLIQHSYHMSIANIVQLYLNLDINKHQNSAESQNRAKIKMQVLQQIINKIQVQTLPKGEKSNMVIENLCGILCETIQKYYLIINGKQMMEIITAEKSISLFMNMIKNSTNSQNAFPAFNFFISLINYYSFSAFNADTLNNEDGKKNLQRLESQPMIVQLTNYFSTALQRIMKSSNMSLYLYRLLQVLCHCISMSSFKILECTRKTQFFDNLVKLMFKYQKINILHVLIEKSFLHIFISDRKIYQQYKKHLFCEIDIIDSTAGFFMRQFSLDKLFEQGKKKNYFGHFMRILKIYSGINTQDQQIVQAIRSKSELWTKISKYLIIPYENVYEKKLGTYEQVPEPEQQQYKLDKNPKIKSNPMKNSTIQMLKKQQIVPPAVMIKSQIKTDSYSQMQAMEQKKAEEMFYRAPIQGFLANNQIIQTNLSPHSNNGKQRQSISPKVTMHTSQHIISSSEDQNSDLKKTESFKDFMNKKKVEAGQQIKLKRSLSQQRRLSGQRTKLSSPSPSKKNSWKDESNQNILIPKIQEQNKFPMIAPYVPKIPITRKNLTQNNISQRPYSGNLIIKNQTNSLNNSNSGTDLNSSYQNTQTQNTASNHQDISKLKVFYMQAPVQKRYRRANQEDRLLFDFLGLAVL